MSGGPADGKQAEREAAKDAGGERVAKVIARSGICSRRDAERLIGDGRVAVNGRTLTTPAMLVAPSDRIEVDGALVASRERTRLWLFNKPKGLVTTNRDPEGRQTVFSALPADLPRVLSVGRLDINTEGLLLLTNDGGLARVLELPATGWLRRYRVRAHGNVDQRALDALGHGISIDGMIYGAVEAAVDRVQGTNIWLTIGLREGKNREVKRVLEHLGLSVNRLIRVSYGPFQLGDLEAGEVREVRGRVLRDQLGEKLAKAAGADFDAPIRLPVTADENSRPKQRAARGGKVGGPQAPQEDRPKKLVRKRATGEKAVAAEAQRGRRVKPDSAPKRRSPHADRRRSP